MYVCDQRRQRQRSVWNSTTEKTAGTQSTTSSAESRLKARGMEAESKRRKWRAELSQKVRESKRRCSRQDRSTAVLCCTTVVLSVEARDQNRRKRERKGKKKKSWTSVELHCQGEERKRRQQEPERENSLRAGAKEGKRLRVPYPAFSLFLSF